MKKNIIFALIVSFTFSCAYSQFSAGMHVGFSNKNTVAGIHSQYQFKNKFTVGLNLTAHADDINPAFLQSRFGYMIGNPNGVTIQPYLGYSYVFHSVDKDIQGSQFTKGIQLRLYLKRNVRIYSDLNIPASGFYIFSVGLTGML